MILMLEANPVTQKKLCDLLNRERIISVTSSSQIFEMVCKYKEDVYLVISNILLLGEIVSHEILFKLCQKLAIEPLPILCFYEKPEEKLLGDYAAFEKRIRFIEYNHQDENFPEKFIRAIRQIYPSLNADIEQARECWQKEPIAEDLTDFRKWIADEFPEKVEQKEEKLHVGQNPGARNKDYQKMYYDLKKKYDELLKTISEIMDTIGNNKEPS